MTTLAPCAQHRVPDERGHRAAALPLPDCSGRTEYGVWDDNDGGFVFAADCATESGNWAATLLAEDPDAELTVREVCAEHPEQPAAVCEDCFADDGDDRP